MRSYLLGMWEFRSAYTTTPTDIWRYDQGRELMHKLTFRMFEQ